MASLTFYLDYAPILIKKQKSAFILYCYYDKLKNDEGIVQLTLKDMEQHTGLKASTTIKAKVLLVELGLIKQLDKTEFFRGIRYQLPELKPLTLEKRNELFSKCDLVLNSKVRNKYENPEIPKEYQQLLDINKMKKAYEELGITKFSIAKSLARYFKLDCNTLRLFMETNKFSDGLTDIRAQVKNQVTSVEGTSIKGTEEKIEKTEPKVQKIVTKTKKVKTPADLYQQFITEGNLKRGTNKELAITEWKSPQILWYFCVSYKKKYGVDFSFTSSNLYRSKEIKDMSRILTAFTGNATEVKSYFDWAFNVKEKQLNGIASTGIIAHVRMINEFKKSKTKASVTIGSLPTDFVSWVKQNEPTFLDISDCKTFEDIELAKEAVRTGDASTVTKRVIAEAVKRGM